MKKGSFAGLGDVRDGASGASVMLSGILENCFHMAIAQPFFQAQSAPSSGVAGAGSRVRGRVRNCKSN